MSTASERQTTDAATENGLDDPEFVENMKDVTCASGPPVRDARERSIHGARFDWRCKVACDDDDSEESHRYRHATVTVVILHKSQLKEQQERGWYSTDGFRKVHDCGDGQHYAVSTLTFDGQTEDGEENEPNPEQRALVKVWRPRLLDWLENQPEIGTIDVTTCVSGICYVRCYLDKVGGDREMIRFTIERDVE